jgi:hypothetical protein
MKRVALDFNWPLDKVWQGYVNPYSDRAVDCDACERSGYAPRAKVFYDQWYGCAPFSPVTYGAGVVSIDRIRDRAKRNVENAPNYYCSGSAAIDRETQRLLNLFDGQWAHNLNQADVDALVAAERLWDFTRKPRTEEQRLVVEAKVAAGGNSWLPESNGYTPTASEVNEWSLRGIGHDAINANVCIRARCEREGVPLLCATCDGHGHIMSAEDRKLRDEWEQTEPPAGDGYQLWETNTEGSPQSPVFATLDELCAWCEVHANTFAGNRATAANWKKMLEDDNVHHTEGNITFI